MLSSSEQGSKEVDHFAWQSLPNNTHPLWWKDPGLRRCVFALAFYFLAQATGGYDKSLINNLQSIPTWAEALDNPDDSTLGLIIASLSLGIVVISGLADGHANDHIGRKKTMFLGSCFMLVGAILQAAANGRNEFVGGRVLIGVGAAGTLCSGPLLAAEISHPRQRGFVTGFYNTLWYVGSIICAWLSFGTSFMHGTNWAWRIPCIGQAVPAFITVCACYWLPESPRYLVQQGKREEALALLAKYHSNNDEQDPLVLFEMQEIDRAIALDNLGKQRGFIASWTHLLATKANRYRMLVITVLVIGVDWCGTSVISYYLARILTNVGIKSATQQTGIIWNWITSLTGVALVERVGRRGLWLASFGGMLIANIPFGACSALYAKHGNLSAGRAVIFLVFLYQGFYNIGSNPLPYLYTTEILPYSIRANGLAYEVLTDAVHGILGQYTMPIALSKLGWKLYFIYTAFLVLTIIAVYFLFPETKGRSLEEVAIIFGDAPEAIRNESALVAEIAQVTLPEGEHVEDKKEAV
ncbi:hypothetical protein IAT40_002172 [Kwoniella sp. CBS 6097]